MTATRFRPEVADDLAAAWDWYEGQKPGLGDALLDAVERCVEGVTTNPKVFAVVHREVRRALVGRFPFAVFFVVRPGEVTVIAVLHVRRDPGVWRSRA